MGKPRQVALAEITDSSVPQGGQVPDRFGNSAMGIGQDTVQSHRLGIVFDAYVGGTCVFAKTTASDSSGSPLPINNPSHRLGDEHKSSNNWTSPPGSKGVTSTRNPCRISPAWKFL